MFQPHTRSPRSENGHFLTLFIALLLIQGIKGSYSSAPIWRLCPCLQFVAVAITQFEIKSHKMLFSTAEDSEKLEIVGKIEQIFCGREKQDCYRFFNHRAFSHFDTTPSILEHIELHKAIGLTITRSARPSLMQQMSSFQSRLHSL